MTDNELRGMARADLERYANATIGFSEYRDRMDKIRDQIENTVKPLKQISVQTSKNDDYDTLINELVDMGMEYNEMKNEARLVCLQIERKISKIGGIQGAILYRRYCELKEWSVICCELRKITISGGKPFCYEDRWIYKNHDKALLEYGKLQTVQ